MACNAGGSRGVSGKCTVRAGDTVTIEMHQQPGQRSCGQEGIGGAHYGPVMAYMSKVGDASTADPAAGNWFKVFEDGWASSGASVGDEDFWGTKDLNKNCGRLDFKIPSDIAAGDYLLRAEVIALHAAGPGGGAQPYMSCCEQSYLASACFRLTHVVQLIVTGGGSNNPTGVKFPGAYKDSDPGIAVSIHQKMNSYVVPGPSVISGGTVVKAGTGSSANAGAQKTSRRSLLSNNIWA